MGLKKRNIDIEEVAEKLELYQAKLGQLLKPLFGSKKVLIDRKFSSEINTLIYYVIHLKLKLDPSVDSFQFTCDGIDDRHVVVEGDIIKFLGIIWWLEVPKGYKTSENWKDPFYCEFRIVNESLSIQNIMFGDYKKTPIYKILWYENNIEWEYDLSLL